MNAEIKFIQYLLEKVLDVIEPTLSKDENYLLNKNTPWGKYLVYSFKKVEGDRLDGFNSSGIDWTDELIIGYGRTLAKLHKYSSKHEKTAKKSSFEMIDEMEYFAINKLKDKKELVTKELSTIKDLFKKYLKINQTMVYYTVILSLTMFFIVKKLKNIL